MSAVEETWTANLCGNACECSSSISTDNSTRVRFGEEKIFFANDGSGAVAMHGRLKIAACAPEMARILMDVIPAMRHTYPDGVCPWCRDGNDHEEVCPVAKILVKAGLRQSPPAA